MGKLDIHTQKREITPFPHTIHKNPLKADSHLNGRLETIKLLEGNTGESLHDLVPGNDFLDETPKTQATEANRQVGTHQTKKLMHRRATAE